MIFCSNIFFLPVQVHLEQDSQGPPDHKAQREDAVPLSASIPSLVLPGTLKATFGFLRWHAQQILNFTFLQDAHCTVMYIFGLLDGTTHPGQNLTDTGEQQTFQAVKLLQGTIFDPWNFTRTP